MSRYFEKMGIGDGIEGGNEFNNFALTNFLRHFSAGHSIIEYIFLKPCNLWTWYLECFDLEKIKKRSIHLLAV